MLKPWIKFGWPANNSETRLMTPGVSILPRFSYPQCAQGLDTTDTHVWLLKSFMMSRNLLYTSGCSENWTLTWSR